MISNNWKSRNLGEEPIDKLKILARLHRYGNGSLLFYGRYVEIRMIEKVMSEGWQHVGRSGIGGTFVYKADCHGSDRHTHARLGCGCGNVALPPSRSSFEGFLASHFCASGYSYPLKNISTALPTRLGLQFPSGLTAIFAGRSGREPVRPLNAKGRNQT